jgi:hypothetical protein
MKMGEYWRLLADYNAESTTYTACAGTAQTSPYTPDENGTLVGLRVIAVADAATTLTEGVQFRLTCTKFKPNSIEAVGYGSGLATVPNLKTQPVDYSVNQPVQAGVPIKIEARNITADTPVGVRVLLVGKFVS